jgi:hypothetical protein
MHLLTAKMTVDGVPVPINPLALPDAETVSRVMTAMAPALLKFGVLVEVQSRKNGLSLILSASKA